MINFIIVSLLLITFIPLFLGLYKWHHCFNYYVTICQYSTDVELSEESIFWDFYTNEPKFKDYWLSGLKLKPVLIHLLGFRTTHKGEILYSGYHKTQKGKGKFEDVFNKNQFK